MKPAVLNCENMRDLCHILLSEGSRVTSRQLLSLALSDKTAFCRTANFAKKQLVIRMCADVVYAFVKTENNEEPTRFFDIHFVCVFRTFITEVELDYIPTWEPDLTSTFNFLKDVSNLNFFMLRCAENHIFDQFDDYNRMLETAANCSQLMVGTLFFTCLKRLPTAIQFPNLKILFIADLLSRIDPSKFTESTYPLLESVDFHETSLSKEGIRKLAKLCNVMRRTIKSVLVTVKFSPVFKAQRNIGFLNLFCGTFREIKFAKDFDLLVTVPFDLIDDEDALENAGFEWQDSVRRPRERLSCKKQFDNVTITFNAY